MKLEEAKEEILNRITDTGTKAVIDSWFECLVYGTVSGKGADAPYLVKERRKDQAYYELSGLTWALFGAGMIDEKTHNGIISALIHDSKEPEAAAGKQVAGEYMDRPTLQPDA